MQPSRDANYGLKPTAGYLPQLMVIIIRGTNYSKDDQRGTVRDVVFRDVAVAGPKTPPSSFRGFDAEHAVEAVRIEGLRLNGDPVREANTARLAIEPHVGEVRFVDATTIHR